MGGEVKFLNVYVTWRVPFQKKKKRKIVHHVHAVVNEGGEVG